MYKILVKQLACVALIFFRMGLECNARSVLYRTQAHKSSPISNFERFLQPYTEQLLDRMYSASSFEEQGKTIDSLIYLISEVQKHSRISVQANNPEYWLLRQG